jgi:hypothetical protein
VLTECLIAGGGIDHHLKQLSARCFVRRRDGISGAVFCRPECTPGIVEQLLPEVGIIDCSIQGRRDLLADLLLPSLHALALLLLLVHVRPGENFRASPATDDATRPPAFGRHAKHTAEDPGTLNFHGIFTGPSLAFHARQHRLVYIAPPPLPRSRGKAPASPGLKPRDR